MKDDVNSRYVVAANVVTRKSMVASKRSIIAGVIIMCFVAAFGGLVHSYLSYVEESRIERLESQQRQQAVEIERQKEQAYQAYLDRKVYAAQEAEKIEKAWRAKEEAAKKQQQAAQYGNFTEGQFELLAMVTFAESGGQPYEDQVRVAETIVKRIASERYPNTLEGVLNQPGQFETINGNGQVVMGYQKRVITYSDVSDTCKNAVREAVNGSNYLPAGGRLEFRGSNGSMVFF